MGHRQGFIYKYVYMYVFIYVYIQTYMSIFISIYTYIHVSRCIFTYIHISYPLISTRQQDSQAACTMGWLRLVGSLKLYVSFAKEPYKRDYVLQKRPIIL